ncbi:glycosyltransferase family 4 protein [Aliagarivorans taiwanensis]|uniref:glycosyltransferase family 4 protein n=1 Tax=Aliagarivorans taiwanensis TaxID=561966 RepID=UPI00041462BA|nr:glycosyltransferase family 4 protein [Aliagarivorans taiwanensis]
MAHKPGLLLVANWDSDVGYAWWLIEGFWASIAKQYATRYQVYLAFPSISKLPKVIAEAPITCIEQDFHRDGDSSVLEQLRFIRQHRIQAIYFTDQAFVSLRYPLYRLAGVCRIINHDHTPGERCSARGLKRVIKSLRVATPGMAVDIAIATTDYIRQRTINTDCMPPAKCFVASNGIAQHAPDPSQTRQQLGLPEQGDILVTAARANHYKGIDVALEVLAKLKQLRPKHSVYYLLLGDGPHLEEFRQQAEALGIGDRVIFKGRVSGVEHYLQHCSFAIHPSKGEVGYCLAILEYMQAGLAVLVPNNPSVCGATSHQQDGHVYEGVDDAAAALASYLDDPQRRHAHGMAAKHNQASKFDLTLTHQSLLSALQTTLPV